jgi:hypothetical protein
MIKGERGYRLKDGLTLSEIASRLKLSYGSVQRLLAGRSCPKEAEVAFLVDPAGHNWPKIIVRRSQA